MPDLFEDLFDFSDFNSEDEAPILTKLRRGSKFFKKRSNALIQELSA